MIVYAHEGEDHSEPSSPPVVQTQERQLIQEASSPSFEVVLKHEELHTQLPNKLLILISDYGTNQAIDKAKVDLTIEEQNQTAKSISPGVYEASIRFQQPIETTVVINIETEKRSDLLVVEGLQVKPYQPKVQSSFIPWWYSLPLLMLLLIVLAYFRFFKRRVL